MHHQGSCLSNQIVVFVVCVQSVSVFGGGGGTVEADRVRLDFWPSGRTSAGPLVGVPALLPSPLHQHVAPHDVAQHQAEVIQPCEPRSLGPGAASQREDGCSPLESRGNLAQPTAPRRGSMGRSKGSVHRPAHQPMTNTLPKVVTGAGGVGTGGCAGVLGAEAGSSARARGRAS